MPTKPKPPRPCKAYVLVDPDGTIQVGTTRKKANDLWGELQDHYGACPGTFLGAGYRVIRVEIRPVAKGK